MTQQVDADEVVRRIAQQGANALADAWVRIAVLEAQASTNRSAPDQDDA